MYGVFESSSIVIPVLSLRHNKTHNYKSKKVIKMEEKLDNLENMFRNVDKENKRIIKRIIFIVEEIIVK